MSERPTRGARLSGRVYRWMLALYPAAFRARFGAAMVDDFERMYAEYVDRYGWTGPVRLWKRGVWDTLAMACGSRGAESRAWSQPTPNSSSISASSASAAGST